MRKSSATTPVTGSEVWLMMPFFIAAMDSWINYFTINHLTPFRAGLLSALALAAVSIRFRFKTLKIREGWLFLLALLVLSLGVGAISIDNISASKRLPEMFGIIIYFLCGYTCFRWVKNTKAIQNLFLLIGALYTVVCVIALLRIAPDWFPVIDAIWSQEGTLQLRPEVMTDQNFQAFYFIPLAIAYVMPSSIVRFLFITALMMGAFYTLAQLQTRSGTLVVLSVVVLGLASSLRNSSMGRRSLVFIPVLALIVLAIALPFIIKHFDLLLYRLLEMDYKTGIGRLVSATYLFEKVFDPRWWIPQGSEEFLAMYGVFPHSNFTAFFLEGGLLGLIAALGIIAYPAIHLASLVAKGNRDAVTVAIGCGGIGVLVLQLSLYVITHAQVWLWAGSVIGILERLHAEPRQIRNVRKYQMRLA